MCSLHRIINHKTNQRIQPWLTLPPQQKHLPLAHAALVQLCENWRNSRPPFNQYRWFFCTGTRHLSNALLWHHYASGTMWTLHYLCVLALLCRSGMPVHSCRGLATRKIANRFVLVFVDSNRTLRLCAYVSVERIRFIRSSMLISFLFMEYKHFVVVWYALI